MNNKMRLLIGYDGSEEADSILHDLSNGGFPESAEAIILTVSEAWEIPLIVDRVSAGASGYSQPNSALVQEQLTMIANGSKKVAEAFGKKISDKFPKWNVDVESVFGKPAAEIVNKADDWNPDLILVGSQGRSSIGRILLGSVSHKVLNEATCSVRISRDQTSPEGNQNRVLVAVDGSPNSNAIIDRIAERQWSSETEVRLIAVDDPFNNPDAGYLPWNMREDEPVDSETSREWIEKVVTMPKDSLTAKGLNVSDAIRWGDAANMILTEAKEWGADSIFVGARGLGKIKRFLLGSVSSTVATKAKCSVEVIR